MDYLVELLRQGLNDKGNDGTIPARVPTPHTHTHIQIHDPSSRQDDAVVVSEIPVSNTQLHNIATGKLCQLGQPGEIFAVRFMLKSSFKSKVSNFVVRNMVMQIVAVGKGNHMRKEDIATDIKIQTVKKDIPAKKEEIPLTEFNIKDEKKELF